MWLVRKTFGVIIFELVVVCAAFAVASPRVVMQRVPDGGIQPQIAVGEDGSVHLIYFRGDAAAGDVFYRHSSASQDKFSEPIRVNSQPGSAIAAGTIRGAQLAIGAENRVHVAWNGSGKATPKGLPNPDLPKDSPYRLSSPMLYSRMDTRGERFEPQRNLMTHTYSLDGGGSVAADANGNVFVVWHGNSPKLKSGGEAGRAVWAAISNDNGETFAAETKANLQDTGACGCCGLRAQTNRKGDLFVLYRTAEQTVNRDMHLLRSSDHGHNFSSTKLDAWQVPQCVMSSAAILASDDKTFAAWETESQVRFARIDGVAKDQQQPKLGPMPTNVSRKHPVLAMNSTGHIILVWTEGTGWQRGGALAWQVFDPSGKASPGAQGTVEGVPVWSFAAVFASGDDQFTIVY